MKLYSAIDLHATNNYLAIIDGDRNRLLKKKLANDPQLILRVLMPFQADIAGIVVESTYNWYWLVDALMEEGYQVHLANPSAIQKYSGLKHADDNHDAFWLAELLMLGILPHGYIYPKQQRPIRDLLRKRSHLVRLRTSLVLSLQNIITRNCGVKVNANNIKALTQNRVYPHLLGNEDLSLAGMVSKESIDFLTRQITKMESFIENKVKLQKHYQNLLTIPGVGKILALTIVLETGAISRFPKVGNYVSYCRKVASRWTSNEKLKGKGNTKNGNKYLAWAFSEAAQYARRYHQASRNFYNRKRNQTNVMVAHNALAHKLARAAYYIIRDNVAFEEAKLYRQKDLAGTVNH
jgi:transposase